MRVLLIGGAGFLGGTVGQELLQAGHQVTTLSRGHRAPLAGAEALIADRRDLHALKTALEGRRFDFTVDLAAYEAADVEKLLLEPRAVLGPYVLISSGQVYLVTNAARAPYVEEDSAAPLVPEPAPGSADHREWVYGVGKRRAESALLGLRASHGVRGAILRLPVLIGEGDVSLRLWAYLERMLDGGPLLLADGGARPTRFLDARDVARVVRTMAESGMPRRAVYNLAQPRVVPLREALQIAASAIGRSPRFVDAPWSEIETAALTRAISPYAGSWVSVLDPTRAADELGFAGTPIEEYLPRVARQLVERRPDRSHPGYAERAREIEVAERLADVRA